MDPNTKIAKTIRWAALGALATVISLAGSGATTVLAAQYGTGNVVKETQADDGGRKNTIALKAAVVPSPLVPDDPGRFNLLVNGRFYASAVGDGGGTPLVPARPGSHVISETAAGNTHLPNYRVSFSCEGTGLISVTQTGPTTASVSIAPGAVVECVVTNTNVVQPGTGTLKVIEQSMMVGDTFGFTTQSAVPNTTVPENAGIDTGFALTTPSGGALNQATYTLEPVALPAFPANVVLRQAHMTGWRLMSLNCVGTTPGGLSTWQMNSPVVTVSLHPDEEVVCTFTSAEISYITITVATDPPEDAAEFYVNVNAPGFAPQSIRNGESVRYQVAPGAYSVTETLPENWMLSSNPCQNVMVGPGQSITCTLINTKVS